MLTDKILSDLREVQEKYKDRTYSFGEVRICDMAKDCADVIAQLQAENERLAAELAAAVEDMKVMADAMRDSEELSESCCFACICENLPDGCILPYGECPGYEETYCFEWRGTAKEARGMSNEEFNAAVELLNMAGIKKMVEGIAPDRLQAICQAERENRLVVLPCKVGDILYGYPSDWYKPEIMKWKTACIHYSVNKKGEIKATVRATVWEDWKGKQWAKITEDIPFIDFGKTVFLTREAAEVMKEGEK